MMSPSVQSSMSMFITNSGIVYAVAPSMWKEPSPSGHTSSLHSFCPGPWSEPPGFPPHGPRLAKKPGQRTVLPHSQMSAVRRTDSNVLWLESKWFSMKVSVINLSK